MPDTEPVDMEKKAYRVREYAEAYGLDPMTLYRAIYRGELPAIKVGRSIRITEEGFRSFIKEANPRQKENEG